MQISNSVDVIIPVYKPDKTLNKLIGRLYRQTVVPDNIYIVQTYESDPTNNGDDEEETAYFAQIKDDANKKIVSNDPKIHISYIGQEDFDHGAVRDNAIRSSAAEYCLLMTQDAIPADRYLIENLLKGFEDTSVGIVYARQMTDRGATRIERHTREYNYPGQSRKKSKDDEQKYGIKTYFCSDVCAMYRRLDYLSCGGFDSDLIFNEDMLMAYKMMHEYDKSIVYEADARVIHYHNYSLSQQLKRSFDIGVSQKQHSEVFENISSEKEGMGYVGYMIKKLLKGFHIADIMYFILVCAARYIGFRLGKLYDRMPERLVKKLTASPWYFSR